MIRAVLFFLGLCAPQVTQKCSSVLALSRDGLCEVWVRCNSIEDMFTDIELAINSGSPLEEIAFLTSVKVKGYMISKEIVEANKHSNQTVEGLIEFEFYTPIEKWIDSLSFKRISIDVKNRRAIALLEKPVSIEQLFDVGIRLLKPKRVPP